MLRKKLAGFLGILMVSVSVLAGCSDAKADKAVQVTEGKETQGQEAQKEKPVIGVSLATLQFPFYQDMQRGIEKAAGEDFEIAFVDCNGDEQVQMNSIENFIQMDCKAVIMTYQNFDTLKNICTPLIDADIPIILCDAGPTDFVYQAIGTDNRIGGRTAGKWVAQEYLKDVDKNEELDVVLLIPPAGTSAKDRAEGFEEVRFSQTPTRRPLGNHLTGRTLCQQWRTCCLPTAAWTLFLGIALRLVWGHMMQLYLQRTITQR